jgi:hypothetical protein
MTDTPSLPSVPVDLPYIQVDMRYTVPMAERPVFYYQPDAPPPPPAEAHSVKVHDFRPIRDSFSLDRQGFALLDHTSDMKDFWDEDEVRGRYYAEAEHLVTQVTGARRAHVFDHVLRRKTVDANPTGHIAEPASRVHVDRSSGNIGSSFLWRSSQATRLERLRKLLGDEADELLRGRIQVITLWRPTHGPLEDMPLGMCDWRTIGEGDLVPSDLEYGERVSQGYAVVHNPGHIWYYAPRMQPNEVLLLKCSDSMTGGCAQFVAHAAFEDPTMPPDALPRASLEVRMLVFHAS